MTKTLVTGAAGFTGRHLVRLLAAQGHDVHGVAHHASVAPVEGATRLHIADLTDPDAIVEVVNDVRPRHVVHLAAIAFVGHGDIGEMYRANIVGTRQLLDALASVDDPPASVIVASSANVYGNSRDGVLDETLLPAPVNDYGVTKVAAEYVARIYAGKLPLIVVRPFNYTGRGQAENFLIPKIISHARQQAAVIELGNVDIARDFSDVRSVVEIYAKLLTSSGAIGGTFNVCSGRAVTLGQVLDLVSELTGHVMEVRVNPAFVRADEVKTLSGSAAKLESVIGRVNGIPLDETLRWMLDL